MTAKRQQSRHLPAFVLLLLAETPMHGGALQSALNARLPALKADSAAVYRTLQQSEKDGELLSEWDTAAAARRSGFTGLPRPAGGSWSSGWRTSKAGWRVFSIL